MGEGSSDNLIIVVAASRCSIRRSTIADSTISWYVILRYHGMVAVRLKN